MSIAERSDGRPGAFGRGRGGGPELPRRGAPDGPGAGPPREPMFRAPWPPLVAAAAIIGAYGLQTLAGDPRAMAATFGFAPSSLVQGGGGGLLTSMFVHASWPHALINALAAVAFGAPVARALGARASQAAAFFVFYLVCGVLAALGFALVHFGQSILLVGASGAVSGLMGAASRILPGRTQLGLAGLAPLTSRGVIIMAVVWALANVALGIAGLGVGAGGAPLAWEAHIAGYAAGLFLIDPLLRLAGRRG